MKGKLDEKDEFGKTYIAFADSGLLNSSIMNLKDKLKIFYRKNILPKLFEYEILK
ncbi:hypothetical protein [Metamycoplasma hyosynoviae]|uniref:hypothetical protein n=1 Tax=Metamycoplasma hyosynoviae TaxID=29559 RepID=UPI00235F8F3C|nr:hypothetical protein [Metamycoplasma hyosynoviae]MDD1359392.1 hypothetical protein [Metamycoplasma hyosynoviae]